QPETTHAGARGAAVRQSRDPRAEGRPGASSRLRAAFGHGVAIHLAGNSRGDDAVDHILLHEPPIAVMRVAVASGAGRDDRHGLPGLQESLRPDRRLDAGAVHDTTAPALAAAEQAPRRRCSAAAVDEGVALVILGANLTPESKASAPPPGTTGVL